MARPTLRPSAAGAPQTKRDKRATIWTFVGAIESLDDEMEGRRRTVFSKVQPVQHAIG